eukprot:scaffold56621_cov40-Attheya_sp.AAC.2
MPIPTLGPISVALRSIGSGRDEATDVMNLIWMSSFDPAGSGGSFQSCPLCSMPIPSFTHHDNLMIYFTSQIKATEWTSAYYMAPLTGAVLQKILESAVDYPLHHPRYQPFQVVSHDGNSDNDESDDNLVLKSSSAQDFVWHMLDAMANLYVDIDPVLVPPRQSLQLYVASHSDISKVSGFDPVPTFDTDEDLAGDAGGGGDANDKEGHDPNNKETTTIIKRTMAQEAVQFLERFYSCAMALKTAQYDLIFRPPPSHSNANANPTTLSPTASTDAPSTTPTIQMMMASSHMPSVSPSNPPTEQTLSLAPTTPPTTTTTTTLTSAPSSTGKED